MAADDGTEPRRRATATSLKVELAALRSRIAMLEAQVADRQLEVRATAEREQMERHLSVILRMTADLMSAQAAAAELEGELIVLRTYRTLRPWWLRMLNG